MKSIQELWRQHPDLDYAEVQALFKAGNRAEQRTKCSANLVRELKLLQLQKVKK